MYVLGRGNALDRKGKVRRFEKAGALANLFGEVAILMLAKPR